ncbi:MAG: right-handed parallel beta-helix repeat-containing protein, partial [Methylococcales bacterium]|nr:right-handed parallel beta-helix repeat-containing protein [Methylococcales bacterium]
MNRNNFPIWDAWQAEVDGAQDKPWLAGLLFKRRQRLFGRFAEVYRQLCALPRRVRRGLQRRTAMTLAGVALMMVLGRAPTSHASTAIIVDPGAKGLNPDGQCSLVEAMLNASFDTAFSPDCSVGSGADTITLAGNTYSYAYANGFNSALPHIQNDPLTIEANGAVFERAAGSSANFNVFTLSNDATLTLNEATITGGANNDSGGGIRVNTGSALILNNSTVSNNETMQQGGGIYIASGSTGLITNSTISGNRANFGAGILSLGGDMTIVTSTISGNT